MKRIINGELYDIKPKMGEHYEVFDDRGAFLFSADSYSEIVKEIMERDAA